MLCTQHVLNLYFSCNLMNNLLSYNGLIDAKMSTSDKDLPVEVPPLMSVWLWNFKDGGS